jgi:hypothetical protein
MHTNTRTARQPKRCLTCGAVLVRGECATCAGQLAFPLASITTPTRDARGRFLPNSTGRTAGAGREVS